MARGDHLLAGPLGNWGLSMAPTRVLVHNPSGGAGEEGPGTA